MSRLTSPLPDGPGHPLRGSIQQQEVEAMRVFQDLTGQRFCRLFVLWMGPRGRNGAIQYWCICACGRTRLVDGRNLSSKNTQSCGCKRDEQVAKLTRTHGKTKTPEYAIWTAMLQRCANPNNAAWKDYGGRGITVCPAWKKSFETFLADMGPRPTPKHSIERRNNNLGYAADNCFWATRQEQNRNSRKNVLLPYQGRTQCLAAWGEEIGIEGDRIRQRIQQGWSIERAVTTPLRHQNRPKKVAP